MNIFSHPISRANNTANPAHAGCIGCVGYGEPKMLACVLTSLRTQDWAHFDRTTGFTIDGRTNTGRLMI
jgi:hypothetical protein